MEKTNFSSQELKLLSTKKALKMMLKSGDKFSPERTLKTLKYEKELESLQNELIHGHGVSLAQVPLPFFLVVDLPSLIQKSWLREVFLALRHFPCPRAWQAPHARCPPLHWQAGS